MARVLYLSQDYTVHDHRFLEKLGQSEHEVWFQPCTATKTESRALPKRIHPLEPLLRASWTGRWPHLWRAASALRRTFTKIDPQIIHAGPVQSAAFLAAMTGAHPLLTMSWGSDVLTVPDRNPWQRWITRTVLRRSDAVLADCLAVRDRAQAFAPRPLEDYVLLPWGINLHDFQKEQVLGRTLRERLKWGDVPVIVYTRGFDPIHNPLLFISAMKQVFERGGDVRILMLGMGTLHDEALRLIDSAKLADRFHLAGRIPNDQLLNYYNASDLYVSTTRSDGSSISLLEAMACQLPVIAQDAYGNREWIDSGKNGWLTLPGNAGALADQILDALKDPARRQTMGRRGREIVTERADWDKNFPRVLQAYDTLLKRSA